MGTQPSRLLGDVQAFCLPFVGEQFARVAGMQPISVIRRVNLAALVQEAGGQAPFADKVGKDKNQVYQWLIEDESNPQSRNMKHGTARAIEEICGRPVGWLDVVHEVSRTATAAQSQSQPARLTGGMILAAYREAKKALQLTGDEADDFDPLTDLEDAQILARAILQAMQEASASGGTGHVQPEVGDGAARKPSREVGGAGGAPREAEAGRESGAKARKSREHAA